MLTGVSRKRLLFLTVGLLVNVAVYPSIIIV